MADRHSSLALSIADVARLTNVCRDKIYQAIKAGDLPARKMGARTLVLRTDLDSYLASLPRLKLRPPSAAPPRTGAAQKQNRRHAVSG